MCKVDVIIPVYRPDDKFKSLLSGLGKQSVRADRIILLWTVPDGGSVEDTGCGEFISCYMNGNINDTIEVIYINQNEFDHGGTRAYGAGISDAEYMLFMTQDAVSADGFLIEKLLESFEDEKTAAAYARQLPAENATAIEIITRKFNYPETERIQNAGTLHKYGIKTYFCSDVCAMYRKVCYDEAGGFIKHTIFNEDMLMAARLVKLGYTVRYTPEAKVVHSHHYSYREQYKRNFDLAVSQKEHLEVFDDVPSEGEGIRLILTVMKELVRMGKIYMIPGLIIESAFKYLGYRKGKRYNKLSGRQIMRRTMNKSYWTQKEQ